MQMDTESIIPAYFISTTTEGLFGLTGAAHLVGFVSLPLVHVVAEDEQRQQQRSLHQPHSHISHTATACTEI